MAKPSSDKSSFCSQCLRGRSTLVLYRPSYTSPEFLSSILSKAMEMRSLANPSCLPHSCLKWPSCKARQSSLSTKGPVLVLTNQQLLSSTGITLLTQLSTCFSLISSSFSYWASTWTKSFRLTLVNASILASSACLAITSAADVNVAEAKAAET